MYPCTPTTKYVPMCTCYKVCIYTHVYPLQNHLWWFVFTLTTLVLSLLIRAILYVRPFTYTYKQQWKPQVHSIIGGSLSEPHISGIALCMCVCMFLCLLACLLACLRLYTISFKWVRLCFQITKTELIHVVKGLLPECSVSDPKQRRLSWSNLLLAATYH